MPEGEGEEKSKKLKTIWKNNERELPPLAKETDFQEAQKILKKLDPRKHTPRHIIILLPKIKDKERILKAAREKETVTYKGISIRI